MPDYWRFRVRLLDVSTELSRVFLLEKLATFLHLHHAIQDACGWGDCHLFAFHDGDPRKAIAGVPDEDFAPELLDAAAVKLSSYFPRAQACIYQYDFGDDWTHEVTLEEVETKRVRFVRRLVSGKGTFPPEDCGSTPGYERCVAAVTGRGWQAYGDEEDRAELLGWLDGWTPDSFDLAERRRAFNI